MGKNERKAFKMKKGTQVVDFKRRKVKVGKKLKPANATDTSFTARSVRMPGQNSMKEKGDIVTKRNLNMKDLMVQLGHYNAKVRKDAIWGIKELTSVHQNVVLGGETLGRLLRRLIELVVDNDTDVRIALLELLKHLFQHVDEQVGSSIVNIYIAYIGSAMSNLESDIRLHAIDFASILLNWNPTILKKYEGTLLPNYIALLKSSLSIRSASSTDGFAVGKRFASNSNGNNNNKSKRKNESKHLKRISKVIDGINMLITYAVENNKYKDQIQMVQYQNNVYGIWNQDVNNNHFPPLYGLNNIAYRNGNGNQVQQISIQESCRSRSLETGSTNNGNHSNNRNYNKDTSIIQLLNTLIIAWNHSISFLNIKSNNNSNANSSNNNKRNYTLEDISITINTMKRIVDIFYALVDRIDNNNSVGTNNIKNGNYIKNNKHFNKYNYDLILTLRNTLLNAFPIEREGSIGNLPFVEIAGLNASLCRALVRLSKTLGMEKDHHNNNNNNNNNDEEDDETGEEEIWGKRIANYLTKTYERETKMEIRGSDHIDDNNIASNLGMIALVEVLPHILFEVNSNSFRKVLLAFTNYFKVVKPANSACLGSCLEVILNILKSLSKRNSLSTNHGLDGKDVLLVWTGMIPKLVWKLGKNMDQDNVQKCFQILYTILHMSNTALFANVDDDGMLEKHLGMLVMFFYTKVTLKNHKTAIVDKSKSPSASSTSPPPVKKKEMYGPFFKMDEKVQKLALNVFFYAPNINQFMLRAFAVCINHPSVSQNVRVQILELIFHRLEKLGPALYLSFMISALVDPNNASKMINANDISLPLQSINMDIEETNEEIRTIGLLFRHRASVVNDICYILENYVNDTLLLKAFTAQLITQLVNFHSNTQDESKISKNDLSKEIVEIYPLLLALKACLKTLKHNHKSLYKINANDRKIILSCLYKFMGLRRHDNMIKNECTLLIVNLLSCDEMLETCFFNDSILYSLNILIDDNSNNDSNRIVNNIHITENLLMSLHYIWNFSSDLQSKWMNHLKLNEEDATKIKNQLNFILKEPNKYSSIMKLVLTLKVEMFE